MKISKAVLEKFSEDNTLTEMDEMLIRISNKESGDSVEINPELITEDLLKYLLIEDTELSIEEKSNLALKFLSKNKDVGVEDANFWDCRIKSLSDFIDACEKLKKIKINADYNFRNRKYPVSLKVIVNNATRYTPKHITISFCICISPQNHKIEYSIQNSDIMNIRKEIPSLTFRMLMEKFYLYEQNENILLFEKKLLESADIKKKVGTQVNCEGIGISTNQNDIKFESGYSDLIWDSIGRKNAAIIDIDLVSNNNSNSERYLREFNFITKLPYVRVFSVRFKKFFYVHIDDISDYNYDDKAFEKLYLPENAKQIIQKVFSHSIQNLSGDIIDYKHGGLIIMAEGNPGTGKTSTAEVYSELNKKPLYVVQIDEIGTDLKNVEENLNTIFKRVERWDAILLFDEIDILLSKRNENIQNSAIVGVFLRLMDYFRGIMFLTTNRLEVIDEAVLSRLTLSIKYPDITKEFRKKIWLSKLQDAAIKIDSVEKLSDLNINGRQIRNMVRLGKIIFDNKIEEKKYIDLIKDTLPNYSEF
jgi:hypothetical protein